MKPDIGKRILDIADSDSLKACVSIGGQSIGWRNLVFNFGKSKSDSVGRFGHFDFRDVKFLPPVTVLSRIDPGLRWWLGLEYVGFSQDKTVSFNITDAALNYANGSAFEAASSSWLELDLKDELLSRYLTSPWVEDHLLQQLEENSF